MEVWFVFCLVKSSMDLEILGGFIFSCSLNPKKLRGVELFLYPINITAMNIPHYPEITDSSTTWRQTQ